MPRSKISRKAGINIVILAIMGFVIAVHARETAHAQGAKEIKYPSSADHSAQPAMFYAPATQKPVPLVLALHSWSGNYKQNIHKDIEDWCIQKGWAYIHPDFRGPNNRPEATGSKLVVADILSAVEYARKTANIDSAEIYLVGTSGGGYTALVMAGHAPEMWAGVSVWVPISDLRAWHAQGRYVDDLVKSCGGAPGASAKVDKEYAERSPITYLRNAKGLTLHINAGIHDGHKGSVPISHSLLAFNEVAAKQDQISEEDIGFFVRNAKVPPNLKSNISDPSYGKKRPLFRRVSGNATVTIFDGGHELVAPAAISWIEKIHERKQASNSK
jgi:acetyl esterase/lipase